MDLVEEVSSCYKSVVLETELSDLGNINKLCKKLLKFQRVINFRQTIVVILFNVHTSKHG